MSVSLFHQVLRQPGIVDNHLLAYLSVVDYINLRRATVNHISRQCVKPADLVRRRVESRLKRDLHFTDEQVAHLFKLLSTHDDEESRHIFLTGGFLLTLLTGAPFDATCQDIDLFSTRHDFESNFGFGGDYRKSAEHAQEQEEYSGMKTVMDVCNYKVQDVHVQVVVCRTANHLPSLVEHFDMSVCRNMFDVVNGLYIADLEGVTRQACDAELARVIGQVKNLHHRDTLWPLYQRQDKRIQKYRARGYDVRVVHPPRETLGEAFVMDVNDVRVFNPDDIFELMGTHSPASCVFSRDCKCKSVEDAKSRFCDTDACECDHHMVFYRTLRARWIKRQQAVFAEEYARYWLGENKKEG